MPINRTIAGNYKCGSVLIARANGMVVGRAHVGQPATASNLTYGNQRWLTG